MNKPFNSVAFIYAANYQGYAFIGGQKFSVLKANGTGYIYPVNEAEANILKSSGYKAINIEEVGLDAATLSLKNAYLQKLEGVMTEEQIETIKNLPQTAKDQIRENIDAIINDLKTTNKPVMIDVKPIQPPPPVDVEPVVTPPVVDTDDKVIVETGTAIGDPPVVTPPVVKANGKGKGKGKSGRQ